MESIPTVSRWSVVPFAGELSPKYSLQINDDLTKSSMERVQEVVEIFTKHGMASFRVTAAYNAACELLGIDPKSL